MGRGAGAAARGVPLALVVDGVTGRALRRAFPGEREGRGSVGGRRTDGGMHMTIRDDGVGVAAAAPNPAGFGRNLVEMVVRQMRGTIAWADAGPGTNVEIDIPLHASS